MNEPAPEATAVRERGGSSGSPGRDESPHRSGPRRNQSLREYSARRVAIGWAGLSAGLLGLSLLFPPGALTVRDEANYLGVAQFLLETGSLRVTASVDRLDGLVPWFETKPGGTAPIHPLGLSFLIVPFVALFGWKGGYLFQVLCLVAGGWIFSKLLNRYGAPPWFALLFVLFPPFLLYSRVCMADLPSAVLCLLGILCLVRTEPSFGRYLAGGLVLGVAFLVRPSNAFFIGPLLAAALHASWRARRLLPALVLLGSSAACLALQLGLNVYYLGDPLTFSYSTEDMFSPAHFVPNLLFYLTALVTVFPLMLAALATGWRDGHRWEVVIVIGGLIFYCLYAYADRGGPPWIYLVRGQRFLLPYVAVLLLLYARALSRFAWVDRAGRALYLPLLVAGPLIGVALSAIAQERSLRDAEAARAWIYERTGDRPEDAIVYNVDSSEFVHGIFGPRRYYQMRSGAELDAVWSRAAARAERILVAETDHKFRQGPPYAAALALEGGRGPFRVVESTTIGAIELVLLERRPDL
jgi:hypothetical protein